MLIKIVSWTFSWEFLQFSHLLAVNILELFLTVPPSCLIENIAILLPFLDSHCRDEL